MQRIPRHLAIGAIMLSLAIPPSSLADSGSCKVWRDEDTASEYEQPPPGEIDLTRLELRTDEQQVEIRIALRALPSPERPSQAVGVRPALQALTGSPGRYQYAVEWDDGSNGGLMRVFARYEDRWAFYADRANSHVWGLWVDVGSSIETLTAAPTPTAGRVDPVSHEVLVTVPLERVDPEQRVWTSVQATATGPSGGEATQAKDETYDMDGGCPQ